MIALAKGLLPRVPMHGQGSTLRNAVFLVICASVPWIALAGPSTLDVAYSPELYAATVSQSMYFPVTRAGDAGYDIVLDYHTTDGSAIAGTDYVAVANSTTLPANAAGTFLPVVINAAPLAGPNKSFQMVVDSAVGIGPMPNLSAQNSFPVGRSPYSVVATDLNGDGKLDLIVGNTDDNNVSVLLNTTAPGSATPTFGVQQTFATGVNPYVSSADINGDGKPDIIVANCVDHTVSVLLNTTVPGAAVVTYAPKQTFAAGSCPRAITAADINGDGLPDLIVANGTDSTVSVLLNTTLPGATVPSFAPEVVFPVSGTAVSVVASDFNGDGRPDLVVVDYSNAGVSVLLNTTAPGAAEPTFATQQTFSAGTSPGVVTVADVNEDGRPDLIVEDNDNGRVLVLFNETVVGGAAASFSPAQTVATGLGNYAVAAADVNGDGKPDLIVAGSNLVGSVAVLANATVPGSESAQFIAPQIFPAGALPVALAIADINGDGKPDVIVANLSLNEASVLLNGTPSPTASGTFANVKFIATGNRPTSIAAADLDGDGKPDLIVANRDDSTVSVLSNNTVPGSATPIFGAQKVFSTGLGPVAIASADVNGDGLADLVVANRNSEVNVLLNTTSPGSPINFASETPFVAGANSSAVTIADINNDGKPDIVVANYGDNNISVLLNTTIPGAANPSFTSQVTFATGSSPSSVISLDVNGDGKPDLAITNYFSATISVLLNTTPPGALVPSFTPQTRFSTGPNPLQVVAADLNGDGKPDLIILNENFQSVSVMLNTTAPGATTPSFSTQQFFYSGLQPSSIAVADVNGDGKPDLLVTDAANNVLSVLSNTTPVGGTALQFTRVDYAVQSGSESAIISDLNGDRRPDVILVNPLNQSASILLNTQYESSITGNPATGTILRDIIFANGFE